MASRTKQKEEARARRLAEEAELARAARERNRLLAIAGVVLVVVVIAVVAIAISSGGGGKPAPPPASRAALQKVAGVNSLLAGIPQSSLRLGSPSAKVTVTEFGDLQCPVCRTFALGAEEPLISNDVRSGKVQLIYKSLSTATSNSPNPDVFGPQQAAAYAAGLQSLGWYYILDFYTLQGQEGTNYVTDAYLNGIARLVPGLNFNQWLSARKSPAMLGQVSADLATARTSGFNSTPTIVVAGPKGQAQPIVGAVPYSTLEQAINLVS
jgi:protein-disulfide isomerase